MRFFIWFCLWGLWILGGVTFILSNGSVAFWEEGMALLLQIWVVIGFGGFIALLWGFFAPSRRWKMALLNLQEGDLNFRLGKSGIPHWDTLVDLHNDLLLNMRKEKVAHSEKEKLLEKVLEVSPVGTILLDFNRNFRYVNPAAQELLNLKAWQGASFAHLEGDLSQSLKSLVPRQKELIRRPGGRTWQVMHLPFIDGGYEVAMYLLQEVTQPVYQGERQGYEKVIRMMSHEVNNTVGAVNSILRTIKDRDGLKETEKQALEVCHQRNAQMSGFMENFATVVRLPKPNKEPLDLNYLVNPTWQLMKTGCADAIEWQDKRCAEKVWIKADRGQLEQVVINVLKNSRESLAGTGTIVLKTCVNPPSLVIEDNGKGIKPEDEKALFTPFFSTKPRGQGIGLTLVREILSNHDCKFSLKTSDGITTFVIRFPKG